MQIATFYFIYVLVFIIFLGRPLKWVTVASGGYFKPKIAALPESTVLPRDLDFSIEFLKFSLGNRFETQ